VIGIAVPWPFEEVAIESASWVDDSLAVAVIDALTSQICVVDSDGVIIAVNRAWKQFAASNPGRRAPQSIGVSYLDICRNAAGMAAEEAPAFASGLREVLRGDRDLFQIEYPCHSPGERRWFLARVSPLRRRSSAAGTDNFGAVVSHVNITDRKLVELDYARLAATDPLTGIPNRRFFDEFAKLEINRFLRFGGSSSLLMLDIDHFKSVNDRYGHAAGDEVLRRVASLGKTVFRGGDLFARLGGEEFVCLMPGTDEWGAVIAAQKLRGAIEQIQVPAGSATIRVTASIGLTALDAGDSAMDSVLVRADEALYLAKDDGRNCVRTRLMAPQAGTVLPPPPRLV
jgi:diguanylate cyclase (GGDEF)-like protein